MFLSSFITTFWAPLIRFVLFGSSFNELFSQLIDSLSFCTSGSALSQTGGSHMGHSSFAQAGGYELTCKDCCNICRPENSCNKFFTHGLISPRRNRKNVFHARNNAVSNFDGDRVTTRSVFKVPHPSFRGSSSRRKAISGTPFVNSSGSNNNTESSPCGITVHHVFPNLSARFAAISQLTQLGLTQNASGWLVI